MNNGPNCGIAFARMEILAGLDRAIDAAYARVVRAAKGKWGKSALRDASDAIVTVRVAPASQPQRGAAFLRTQLNVAAAQGRKLIQPRFAD